MKHNYIGKPLSIVLAFSLFLSLSGCQPAYHQSGSPETETEATNEAIVETNPLLSGDSIVMQKPDSTGAAELTEAPETTPETAPVPDSTEAAEPAATQPKATEPKQTEPKQTEPKATEPKQTEPKATEPKTTEPKQTEPKATEPKATEPKQTEPAPTEPAPTEPAPTEPKVTAADIPALEDYARSYAASVGFVIDTSLNKENAGYYPAWEVNIMTMDEMKAYIREGVDATKGELIARGAYDGFEGDPNTSFRYNCIIEFYYYADGVTHFADFHLYG